MKLDKETLRKYEDPEYAKAAEEYERQARREHGKSRRDGSKTSRRKRRESEYGSTAEDFREFEDTDPVQGRRAKKKRNSELSKKYENDKKHKAEKKYKTNKKGSKGKRLLKRILLILLILTVIVLAYFFYVTSHLDKVDTSNADFAIDSTVADDLSGYRNIAILGVDARRGEGYDGSRTDAIIIARIKKSSGDIHLISIMRDSYLKLENYENQLILDKITHAHHFGGGVDTCAALNRSLDLNIKEFVIFNWQAVSDAVDCLDGIEVDIKSNEIADLNKWGPETGQNVGKKYTRITKTGKQTIDGVQATTYCRIRKTSGGDTGRGQRYKKVMSAVMKKALSSPIAMNKLAKEVLPEIRTNMSQLQLLTASLRAPGYDIKKSYGWPKTYYGGLLWGVWYAVPQTLESNVQWLHKRAFEQDNYVLSETAQSISNEIIQETGIK